MKENKISIIIHRPISEVFQFTINPDKTPLWIETILREEINEQSVKIGTGYKNSNSKGEWTEYQVVDFKIDSMFELKQKNGSYSVRYTYEPISEEQTKLTYREWVEEGELDSPLQLHVLQKLKHILEHE